MYPVFKASCCVGVDDSASTTSPQSAILDECTSGASVDVEDAMYQYCQQVAITLFTVSHHKSLEAP